MNQSVNNGLSGFLEYDDTTLHAISSECIEMLAATVLDELHGNGEVIGRNTSTGVVTAGRTYPVGDKLFGNFTGIKLTSGAVRCYRSTS